MRDIGEMGERDLARWAPQAGITANRAERDLTGWDYLLELPVSSTASVNPHLPLDRRPHPVQCLVQVKSTDNRPGRWAVKLDNWKRLVQSPLPAFFLILEYDGENDCQRGYLIHIGDQKIRQVLAKLRHLSVSSPDTPLHRKSLTFTYSESDSLPSLDGEGILNGICRHVPDFEQYTESKQRLLREAGYEEGGQTVEANILVPQKGGENDYEDFLIDFSLGLIDSIRVERGAKVYDERFGIMHPEPIHTIETEGRIESRPLGSGLIYLRSVDGEQERIFEVQAYSSSPVAAFIREENHQIRFKSTFVDFFIHPMADPIYWRIAVSLPPPDQETPLSEFRGFWNLLTLWIGAAPSGEVELELRMEDLDMAGRVIFPEPPAERFVELAEAVRNATRITAHLHVPPPVHVSVNELYAQRRQIELLDGALRADTLHARINFWLTQDELLSDTKACWPFVQRVSLGPNHVVVSGAYLGYAVYTGVVEAGNHELRLDVDSVRVLNAEVLEAGTSPTLDQVGMLESGANEFSDLNVIRWWADL